MGANLPFPVMDGYLRRIWGKKRVDKIVAKNKRIFIVTFLNMEFRDIILNEGFQYFDHKPLIFKKWHPDMNLKMRK